MNKFTNLRNGIAKSVDDHPKRDEIIRRLLQGEGSSKLAREYDLHHASLLRTRKRIQKQVEPLLTASLAQVDPDFAARTVGRPLSAWTVVEDLDRSRRELDELKTRDETKIHNLIQIANTQARIAETLIRIMEIAEKNRAVSRTPEYQMLETAIARTIRRVPGAEEVFNQEYAMLDPLKKNPDPLGQEDIEYDIDNVSN